MGSQIGTSTALSTPCVPGDGYIYFQGAEGQSSGYLHQVDLNTQQDNVLGQNLVIQSAPWVFAGYAYYQTLDVKLWQMKISYDQNPINLGNNFTNSMPCVTDGEFLFFQGSDNRLLAVPLGDPAQAIWLGDTGNNDGLYTAATPWTPGDGFLYFTYYANDTSAPYANYQLLKLELATQQVTPFDGLYTQSTPCVPGDGYLYCPYNGPTSAEYQPNQLFRVDLTTGSATTFLTFQALSSPAVPGDGYMYFEGTDHKLWMVNIANPEINNWVGSDSSGNNGYYTAAAPCAPPGEGLLYFVQYSSNALMEELVWQDYPQPQTAAEVIAGWADAPPRYSPSNWMNTLKTASGSSFGQKSLSQIVVPGSHDAGMYQTSIDPTGNSVTQYSTIYNQLMAGSRYFDLRVRYWDWWFADGFVIYHNTRFAEGPSLSTVVNDVARFMINAGAHETVVLKFSHFDNFDNDVYTQFVQELKPIRSYFFTGLGSTRLADLQLAGLDGKVIVVSDSPYNPPYRSQGIYSYADASSSTGPSSYQADLVVFDSYSNTTDVQKMESDQQTKFEQYTGAGSDLFLLSWTLTPGFPTACLTVATPANIQLPVYYPGSFHNSNPELIVNIIYVDFVVFTSAMLLCWNANAGVLAAELVRQKADLAVQSGSLSGET